MSHIPENFTGNAAAFDQHARVLHNEALSQLSPQTLARIRSARQGATHPKRAAHWRWVLAGTVPALLALGIGLQFLPSAPQPVSVPVASSVSDSDVSDDYASALDESPDLYVWLASADAQRLALE